jgi:hypothetical protein
MNRFGRILVPAIATALVALGLPAMASATDYCVHTTCGGTDVDNIQDALNLAAKADDADRVFIGDGVYTSAFSQGFTYSGTGRIEVIGAGRTRTELKAPTGGGGVLTLNGAPGSSVHDLTITLPQYSQGYGLYTQNDAKRIDVGEEASQLHPRDGVVLVSGGTLEDADVFLTHDTDSVGVAFGAGGGTMRDSTASARTGALSRYGDNAIERSFLQGEQYGLRALRKVTSISSSLVHLVGNPGMGILAEAQGADVTVNADGVTVTGPYVPGVVGVAASNSLASAQNANVNLTNSIIRTGGARLYAFAADGGLGHVGIAASYSDYDPAYNSKSGANAGISQANVSNLGDAGFVDGLSGDWHLSASSPLLDRGDPATLQGFDFDGNPLVADGNGDGIARRDIGAFERQPEPGAGGGQQGDPVADTQAPLVRGFRATPAVFTIARARTPVATRSARGTRLRYTLSEPARVTVALKRAVKRAGHIRYRSVGSLRRSGARGANAIRFSGRLGRRALRPGLYRAVIRATDAAGNRSAAKSIRLRITAR